MDDLDKLAVEHFTGRIVRKDLSKKIKGSLLQRLPFSIWRNG